MVIGGLAPASWWIDKDEPARVMVIDRSGGGESQAIEQRIKLDEDRPALGDLSRYVQRHHLEDADRAALWSRRGPAGTATPTPRNSTPRAG